MYEVTIDKKTGLPVADNSFARVVRCKECKHLELRGFRDTENGRYADCIFMRVPVSEDGFCSWGERRKDAKTD